MAPELRQVRKEATVGITVSVPRVILGPFVSPGTSTNFTVLHIMQQ